MQYTSKSDFIFEARQRGFIKQCSDEIFVSEKASNENFAYVGFDSTANSLHVGSLSQIMLMRLWLKNGGKMIALIGGGTAKVGDPSGKDVAREMLSEESISINSVGIRNILERFLKNEGKVEFVDNADWLDSANLMSFLRENASRFSVGKLLNLETMKRRLNSGGELSLLEFFYPVLQAFDFAELCKRYDCRVQAGGSDQWGNMVSGIDLIRRMGLGEAACFTSPLLETSDGRKMGKSEKGAIWLDEEMTSPSDMWHFFRNIDDRDVGTLLRRLTELPISEISRLESLEGNEINEAKKILATEILKLCHGEDIASQVAEKARCIFELDDPSGYEPITFYTKDFNEEGTLTLKEALRIKGVISSGSEFKRLARGSGISLNESKVNEDTIISISDMPISLLIGKKKKYRLQLS